MSETQNLSGATFRFVSKRWMLYMKKMVLQMHKIDGDIVLFCELDHVSLQALCQPIRTTVDDFGFICSGSNNRLFAWGRSAGSRYSLFGSQTSRRGRGRRRLTRRWCRGQRRGCGCECCRRQRLVFIAVYPKHKHKQKCLKLWLGIVLTTTSKHLQVLKLWIPHKT